MADKPNPFDRIKSFVNTRRNGDSGPASPHEYDPFNESHVPMYEYDETQREVLAQELEQHNLFFPDNPNDPAYDDLIASATQIDPALGANVADARQDTYIAPDNSIMDHQQKRSEKANMGRELAYRYLMVPNANDDPVLNKTLILGTLAAIVVGALFLAGRSPGTATATATSINKTIENADGSVTTTYPDGSSMTRSPDGTETTTNADKSVTVKDPRTGEETTTDEDGRVVVVSSDGSSVETAADGSITRRNPDGQVIANLPPTELDSAINTGQLIQTGNNPPIETTDTTITGSQDSPDTDASGDGTGTDSTETDGAGTDGADTASTIPLSPDAPTESDDNGATISFAPDDTIATDPPFNPDTAASENTIATDPPFDPDAAAPEPPQNTFPDTQNVVTNNDPPFTDGQPSGNPPAPKSLTDNAPTQSGGVVISGATPAQNSQGQDGGSQSPGQNVDTGSPPQISGNAPPTTITVKGARPLPAPTRSDLAGAGSQNPSSQNPSSQNPSNQNPSSQNPGSPGQGNRATSGTDENSNGQGSPGQNGQEASSGSTVMRAPSVTGSSVQSPTLGMTRGSGSQGGNGGTGSGAAAGGEVVAYRRTEAPPTTVMRVGGQSADGQGGSSAPAGASNGSGTQGGTQGSVIYRRTRPENQNGQNPQDQSGGPFNGSSAADGSNGAGASDTGPQFAGPATMGSSNTVAQGAPQNTGTLGDTNGGAGQNAPSSTDPIAADSTSPLPYGPYKSGQYLRAKLETGVILPVGGADSAGFSNTYVYARTQDGTLWLGKPEISATKRIDIVFTQAIMRDGKEVEVNAVGYHTDGNQGLMGKYQDMAPTLANDLIRSSLVGVRSYVEAKIQATKTTTNANGSTTVERQVPTIWESVAGSATGVFQLPENQRTFTTVARLNAQQEFVVVIRPKPLQQR